MSPQFFPRFPNPSTEDPRPPAQVDEPGDLHPKRWIAVFAGGILVLDAWVILTLMGWPGSGLALVPIGVGMLLASAIQLAVIYLAA